MTKVEKQTQDVLNALQRAESRLSWEDQIELLEEVFEFVGDRLREVKDQDQSGGE